MAPPRAAEFDVKEHETIVAVDANMKIAPPSRVSAKFDVNEEDVSVAVHPHKKIVPPLQDPWGPPFEVKEQDDIVAMLPFA